MKMSPISSTADHLTASPPLHSFNSSSGETPKACSTVDPEDQGEGPLR